MDKDARIKAATQYERGNKGPRSRAGLYSFGPSSYLSARNLRRIKARAHPPAPTLGRDLVIIRADVIAQAERVRAAQRAIAEHG